MLDTVFNRVTATALKGYSKRITENITKAKYLMYKLGELGGIETRQGSTSLVEPAILAENTNVGWISHYQSIPTTQQGGISAAEVAWKELAGSTGISFMEKFKNSGQATQIVSLWNAVGKQLSTTMKNRFNTALFGDGVDGVSLTGLLLAVEDSPFSLYAEIDPVAFPNWVNYYAAPAGDISAGDATAVGILRQGMTGLVNGVIGGGDWPHMIVTTKEVHELWETRVLQANEHYERLQTDDDIVRSGFQHFLFKGLPTFWDMDILPHVNTGGVNGHGMLTLNLDYLKVAFGSGYEFMFTDPVQPDNQAVESVLCVTIANMILSRRDRQGRVNFEYSP